MKGGSRWWPVIAGLLLGILVGAGLLGVRYGAPWRWPQPDGQQAAAGANPDSAATAPAGSGKHDARDHKDDRKAEEDPGVGRGSAIVRATREVAPAVVSINVVQRQSVRDPSMDYWERMGMIPHREYYRDVQSLGSGVIVGADGTIVTNYHVIDGAIQIIVNLSDGRQLPASLLDAVPLYDLAVLRVEGKGLPVAHMASSEDLEIGEWAIAIGSPFGYLLADTQPTVTVGVISALNRDIKISESERAYLGMIQTDAAINPGNSGGPLVNTRGEVVGINTFIFSGSGGSVGIGFAVPSSRVMAVVDEVRKFGHYRETNAGFTLYRLSPSIMRSQGVTDPKGAFVYAVTPGSAAWKAGLRPNDILRELGGLRLDKLDTIYRLMYNSSVGDRLSFQAERDHRIFAGEIILEETP
jgi:serine protease Do